ncbi:MAG: hypothetical protein N2319_08875 [Candidatus Kapabacteria bacterium]|nr:hypothetical protein [Candidatus Kapabacteria bacterium]
MSIASLLQMQVTPTDMSLLRSWLCKNKKRFLITLHFVQSDNKYFFRCPTPERCGTSFATQTGMSVPPEDTI